MRRSIDSEVYYSVRWNDIDALVNAFEGNGAPLNKELTQEIIRH